MCCFQVPNKRAAAALMRSIVISLIHDSLTLLENIDVRSILNTHSSFDEHPHQTHWWQAYIQIERTKRLYVVLGPCTLTVAFVRRLGALHTHRCVCTLSWGLAHSPLPRFPVLCDTEEYWSSGAWVQDHEHAATGSHHCVGVDDLTCSIASAINVRQARPLQVINI